MPLGRREVSLVPAIASWGARGLARDRVHTDATSADAVGEECVDLWVATPDCKEHSKANRDANDDDQQASLKGM
jgi:site-specific DNA-cytosine methylase